MTSRPDGAHTFLVLSRATRAVETRALASIEDAGLCASDFGVLEALLHKGALPVNTLGKTVLLTSGSITTSVYRLAERGLVPGFLVHRGHSFYTEKTIRYVTSAAKLVFLGSCGGVTNVHSVIERSRDAQVIATRGIGTTSLNDAILKSLNDWLLRGDAEIDWAGFWQAQKAQLGRNPMFRDYFAPHQDTASILLRAYFQVGD